MPMMGMQMGQQQQPLFGQRPPPAQMPQMGSDPFVQAWMAKAQQVPQAPQMQMPQAAPQQPVAGQGAPGAQPGQQPGQGGGFDIMKLLKLFGGGQNGAAAADLGGSDAAALFA